jgi:hypothetical protein
MSNHTRYRKTPFNKTASNNRWYRWFALASFLVAVGLLVFYLLQ